MVDSLNFAYEYGELSNSPKEAITTFIEKKNRDKDICKLEIDFADYCGRKNRLEKILPYVIHHNQCAYVKGRTIFDAVLIFLLWF